MKPENGTVKKRKEEEKPKTKTDGWDEPEQYQTETCRFFFLIYSSFLTEKPFIFVKP